MRMLIGGSPSTGSSILRQVLNRHSQIFCGPETRMFCYPVLYDAWTRTRRRLFGRGLIALRNADVRVIKGVDLTDDEFGWSRDQLKELSQRCATFPDFCDAFFARPLKLQQKAHWAEKTPANVLQFDRFAGHFEDSLVVHTIRDPYDTVASLMARGMPAFLAASCWLVYTACGVSASGLSGYVEVRYEAFTRNAQAVLENTLLSRMSLSFEPAMLDRGNPHMSGVTRMQGWRSDELDTISPRSIGRFESEPVEIQNLIITVLAAVRLASEYRVRHGVDHDTAEALCRHLDYPYRKAPETLLQRYRGQLEKERRQVARSAMLQSLRMYGYPVGFGN